LAARKRQVADAEDPSGRRDQDGAGGAADVLPRGRPQGSLQLGSIKLAIAKQCEGRIEWDQLLPTANDRPNEVLGQVALFAFDDRPQQWNGPPRIDHAGHQDDTAASGLRAIEQDAQGQLRQSLEQRTSKRQPEGVGSDVLVLDEASKARDQTFVL